MPRYENSTTGYYSEIITSGYVREGKLKASTPLIPFEQVTITKAQSIADDHLANDYVEVGLVGSVWDFKSNPILEKQIRNNIDQKKYYVDYAQWAQDHGQGAFSELVKDGGCGDDNSQYRKYFGELPFQNDINQWRHGFVQIFQSVSDRSIEKLKQFLNLPPLIFLESLNMWQKDVPELLNSLCDWHGLHHLTKLNVWEEYTLGIGDYSFILPKLTHLQIFYLVGSIFVFDEEEPEIKGLDFPELLHFARVSPDLSENELYSLTHYCWPKLEALTLGIGFESQVIAEDFDMLLKGRNFPSLRYLSIRHFKELDAFILLLANSPLLSQLVKLDFYQSDLTTIGAQVLIDNKDKFSHLEAIGIRETALTKADEEALLAVYSSIDPHNPFRETGEVPYIEGIYQEDFWEINDEDD